MASFLNLSLRFPDRGNLRKKLGMISCGDKEGLPLHNASWFEDWASSHRTSPFQMEACFTILSGN